MWALNLAIQNSIDVDQTDAYCGASADAKYIVMTSYEVDENYGYSMYNYYAHLYEVSETSISTKKVFILSSANSPYYHCLISNKSSDQVIVYIYSTDEKLITMRVRSPINENEDSEPLVSTQHYPGLQSIKMAENSTTAEPLLFFSDHIQNINESKRIDYNNETLLYYSYIFVRQDQTGSQEIYVITHDSTEIVGLKLNFFGKKEQTQIVDSSSLAQLEYNSSYYYESIYSVSTSHNNDFTFCLEVSYEYSGNQIILVDDNFTKLSTNFILLGNQYTFLQFSTFPNRLFLSYYHYSSGSYEICYCTYEANSTQLQIDQTLGCYSVGISYLDHIIEMTAGEEDQTTYLLTNGMVIDSTRVDGDPEKQQDLELFFPNDAFSADSYQLSSQNIKLVSSEGYLVEVRNYYSDYSYDYYAHDIAVERPTIAIHPGVIAGFVFAGIFAIALIILAIIGCCYFIKKNIDLSQTNERPVHQNNTNTNEMLDYSQNKTMVMNPRVHVQPQDDKAKKQVNELAKRYGKEENCCICLSKGCNSYLPCMHFFHKNCIQSWARSKIDLHCPLCQQVTSLKNLQMI